jgi:type III secretory pathway component EscT
MKPSLNRAVLLVVILPFFQGRQISRQIRRGTVAFWISRVCWRAGRQ